MEIRVRKATTNDYDTLCELFDEIGTLHRVNLPTFFKSQMALLEQKITIRDWLLMKTLAFLLWK